MLEACRGLRSSPQAGPRLRISAFQRAGPVRPEDAVNLRDGFAKAIYARTFSWMVKTINQHLFMGESEMASDLFVANKARPPPASPD